MSKELRFSEDARSAILRGVSVLANAVRVTLGPLLLFAAILTVSLSVLAADEPITAFPKEVVTSVNPERAYWSGFTCVVPTSNSKGQAVYKQIDTIHCVNFSSSGFRWMKFSEDWEPLCQLISLEGNRVYGVPATNCPTNKLESYRAFLNKCYLLDANGVIKKYIEPNFCRLHDVNL